MGIKFWPSMELVERVLTADIDAGRLAHGLYESQAFTSDLACQICRPSSSVTFTLRVLLSDALTGSHGAKQLLIFLTNRVERCCPGCSESRRTIGLLAPLPSRVSKTHYYDPLPSYSRGCPLAELSRRLRPSFASAPASSRAPG